MQQPDHRAPRPLALVALAAIATFPLALIILNVVQRGTYDALRQPGSQLALGRGGWLLTLGFCGLAIGTLLLAWLLRRAIGGIRAVPILLGVAGALNFVAALSPTDADGVPATTHGLIHNLAGLVSFLLYVAAMVVAAFAFRAHGDWRAFGRATAIWSGCAIGAFVLMLVLAGAHLFGLGQRLAIAIWLSWLLVVAWRVGGQRDTPSRTAGGAWAT